MCARHLSPALTFPLPRKFSDHPDIIIIYYMVQDTNVLFQTLFRIWTENFGDGCLGLAKHISLTR